MPAAVPRRRHQVSIVAPAEDLSAGPGVSATRMWVADVGGEKFNIAPPSLLAEIGDRRRYDVPRLRIGRHIGLLDGRREMVLRCRQNEAPTLITHV